MPMTNIESIFNLLSSIALIVLVLYFLFGQNWQIWRATRQIKQALKDLEKWRNYGVKQLIQLIDMESYGEPIIPPKFGKGILKGFSSVQFMETSSITAHIAEQMLEAHINIFSCKDFDSKKAEEFTKEFFKAQKVKSKLIKR